MEPTFFPTPADFRQWLAANHDKEKELLVGYYKVDSGRPSMTWPESVDQALCYGWIDGIRRRIDDQSYSIRFTPRKRDSTWSAVNLKRIGELIELGLAHSAGIKVFNERKQDKAVLYAYEQRDNPKLDESFEQQFRANQKAWDYFHSQPPWYQRTAVWWVISAKREETRLKRLATLIEDSANHRPLAQLDRRPKPE